MPITRSARRVIAAASVTAAALATSLTLVATSGTAHATPAASNASNASKTVSTTAATDGIRSAARSGLIGPEKRTGGTLYSQSWSGYVTSGPKFRYIQAELTVPAVNCHKTSNAWAYDWIGLDGTIRPNGTVEQDGIAEGCVHGRAEYGAWYETFPKNPVFTRVAIAPHNVIKATVYYDSRSRKYNFTLVNLANGEGFNTWQRCGSSSCRNATAEVITEAPCKTTACNSPVSLADYGVAHYSDVQITDARGQRGGVDSSHWGTARWVMYDTGGHLKSGTSGLARNSAFYTYWSRSN